MTTGFCLSCQTKREIQKPVTKKTPKTKQPYALGKCARCGSKIAKFLPKTR